MHILNAHGAALHHSQARCAQERNDLRRLDMAVPLVEMREKTFLRFESAEVNHEQAAALLQNPTHFADALFTELARQVM